jgi:hypothetical protein
MRWDDTIGMSNVKKEQQGGVQGKVVTKNENSSWNKGVISKCTSQQSNNRAHRNEHGRCERSYDTYDMSNDKKEEKLQQIGVQRRVVMQRTNEVD